MTRLVFLVNIIIMFFPLVCFSLTSNAADIPIEGYVTGNLTLSLSENLQRGISFKPVQGPPEYFQQDRMTYWMAKEKTDYITFSDETNIQGFYITIQISHYKYLGRSDNIFPILASDFQIIGNYENGASVEMTKCNNDKSCNLSILPKSCSSATPDKFSFYEKGLRGTGKPEGFFLSTVKCRNFGQIRFDRIKLTLPANIAPGTYKNQIILTIIDGSP